MSVLVDRMIVPETFDDKINNGRSARMKYQIEITETLQRRIEIETDTEISALQKIEQQYHSGEIVLDPSDYIDTEIAVIPGMGVLTSLDAGGKRADCGW
jgi:hypothetical protein